MHLWCVTFTSFFSLRSLSFFFFFVFPSPLLFFATPPREERKRLCNCSTMSSPTAIVPFLPVAIGDETKKEKEDEKLKTKPGERKECSLGNATSTSSVCCLRLLVGRLQYAAISPPSPPLSFVLFLVLFFLLVFFLSITLAFVTVVTLMLLLVHFFPLFAFTFPFPLLLPSLFLGLSFLVSFHSFLSLPVLPPVLWHCTHALSHGHQTNTPRRPFCCSTGRTPSNPTFAALPTSAAFSHHFSPLCPLSFVLLCFVISPRTPETKKKVLGTDQSKSL